MNCLQCGHTQDEGAYCSRCGADLLASEEAFPPPGSAPGIAPASPPAPGAPPPPGSAPGIAPASPPPPGAPPPPGSAPGIAPASPPAPGAGTRHLDTEGHIRALGFWFSALGVLMWAGVLAGCFVDWLSGRSLPSYWAETSFQRELAVLDTILIVVGSLLFWLGTGLQRFSTVARACAAIGLVLWAGLSAFLACGLYMALHELAVVSLFGLGSSLYSVAAVVVLFSRKAYEVCSLSYQKALLEGGGARGPMTASLFLWIPVVPYGLIVLGLLWLLGTFTFR